MNNETLALHELADNIGVPARYLRHGLLTVVAASFSMATQDADLSITVDSKTTPAINPADSPNPHTDHIADDEELNAGITIAPGQSVVASSAQSGLFAFSNDEGCPGFDYAISGANDDDDPVVVLVIDGILENGQPKRHLLKGSGTVPLPLVAITSALTLTFENSNPGGGSDVTVMIAGTARVAKSGISARGREAMAAAGVPVGKAAAARAGKAARIAEIVTRGSSARRPQDKAAAKQSLIRAVSGSSLKAGAAFLSLMPKRTNAAGKRFSGMFPGLKIRRR